MQRDLVVAVVLVLALGIIGSFFMLQKIDSDVGRAEGKIAAQAQNAAEQQQADNSRFSRVEQYLKTPPGLECEFVEHGTGDAGSSACANNGYPQCIFSKVEVESTYFNSKDGTCKGGAYPQTSRERFSRLLECGTSIDSQTNAGYASTSTQAECKSGGALSTDYWETAFSKGSFCCRQTGSFQ